MKLLLRPAETPETVVPALHHVPQDQSFTVSTVNAHAQLPVPVPEVSFQFIRIPLLYFKNSQLFIFTFKKDFYPITHKLQAVPALINAPIDVTTDVNTTVSTVNVDVPTFNLNS